VSILKRLFVCYKRLSIFVITNIVSWSTFLVMMICIELTLPWEERTDEANKEAIQVPGTGRLVQWERIHQPCLPCGSWIKGFLCPLDIVSISSSALYKKGKTRRGSGRTHSRAAKRTSWWIWFRRRNEVTLKPAQTSIAWSTLLSHIKRLRVTVQVHRCNSTR